MTNIILGVLFVLFLICLYKIASLREEIRKVARQQFTTAELLETLNDINTLEDQTDLLDSQLMSLRLDFNNFYDHYQYVNDRKIEKLVSKKPAKKKAYGKKSK